MTELTPYRRRCLAQTEAWVEGFPFHNREDNECCPDFSCCRPDMFTQEKEKRIAALHELQTRYGLLQ
jgi:hypothetical protein